VGRVEVTGFEPMSKSTTTRIEQMRRRGPFRLKGAKFAADSMSVFDQIDTTEPAGGLVLFAAFRPSWRRTALRFPFTTRALLKSAFRANLAQRRWNVQTYEFQDCPQSTHCEHAILSKGPHGKEPPAILRTGLPSLAPRWLCFRCQMGLRRKVKKRDCLLLPVRLFKNDLILKLQLLDDPVVRRQRISKYLNFSTSICCFCHVF
jgi:hypothetical protein